MLFGMCMQHQQTEDVDVTVSIDKKEDSKEPLPRDEEKKSNRGKTGSAVMKHKQAVDPGYPIEPRVIQVIKKPKSYMNHSYRDFSQLVSDDEEILKGMSIEDMSFPQKVHHILSQEDFKEWVTWMPHGRAFRVTVPVAFEKNISLKYFGHKRYSSFLRQLSNHNFKHISQGSDRNCYYHEFMLRGYPHLCKYMPQPKEARRLISDPDNEPNFYEVSKMYPLSDDPSFGQDQPNTALPNKPQDSSIQQQGVGKLRSADQMGWIEQPPNKRISLDQQLPMPYNASQTHPLFMPFPALTQPYHPIQQQQSQQQASFQQPFFTNEIGAGNLAFPSVLQTNSNVLTNFQQSQQQPQLQPVHSAAGQFQLSDTSALNVQSRQCEQQALPLQQQIQQPTRGQEQQQVQQTAREQEPGQEDNDVFNGDIFN